MILRTSLNQNGGVEFSPAMRVLISIVIGLLVVGCGKKTVVEGLEETEAKTEPKPPSKADINRSKMGLASHAWMSKLADRASLATLNIPGTHNSAALHEPFPKTAKCQALPIMDQLKIGVRFFDVRCRHKKDRFSIYHGPINQRLSFEAFLESMFAFLKDNASEALIVSIKEEHSSTETTRSFRETMQWYIDQNPHGWLLKETISNLGAARRKIVLIRRFQSSKSFGISATDWGHNGFFEGTNLFIQDRFKIPNSTAKWGTIQKAFEHSKKDSSDRLHLHFASGYTQNRLGIPNIISISNPINQKLAEYLKTTPRIRHGCIVLDFITQELAEAIYQLNFPANN